MASLQSPHDDFTQCVKNVAYRAGSALDNLAIKAFMGLTSATSDAPNPTDINWAHPLGGTTSGGVQYFKPLTDGLVILGTSTATARSKVVSGSILTADIVRARYTDLKTNNVPSFGMVDGNPLYAVIAHPAVYYDLKRESGNNSWTDTHKYVAEGFGNIKYAVLGIWEGFIFLESSRMFYQSSGASSVNIFPTLFVGADALGKGFTPANYLPQLDPSIQRVPLAESADIRIKPAGDAQGRFSTVAWYANLAYKIINPKGMIRQELTTSNSSYKTATLSR